jgi:hypothetical protein
MMSLPAFLQIALYGWDTLRCEYLPQPEGSTRPSFNGVLLWY